MHKQEIIAILFMIEFHAFAKPPHSETILGTSVTVGELLMQNGCVTPFVSLAEKPHLCLDDQLRKEFRGAVFQFTAQEYPYKGYRKISDSCNFKAEMSETNNKFPESINIDSCKFIIDDHNGIIKGINLQISKDATPNSRHECLIRQGLVALGYIGALQLENDRLFKPTNKTPFIVYSEIIGSTIPFPVYQYVNYCAPGIREVQINRHKIKNISCKGGAK